MSRLKVFAGLVHFVALAWVYLSRKKSSEKKPASMAVKPGSIDYALENDPGKQPSCGSADGSQLK
jgi:hypothetical protein